MNVATWKPNDGRIATGEGIVVRRGSLTAVVANSPEISSREFVGILRASEGDWPSLTRLVARVILRHELNNCGIVGLVESDDHGIKVFL